MRESGEGAQSLSIERYGDVSPSHIDSRMRETGGATNSDTSKTWGLGMRATVKQRVSPFKT
jgi:hypothetical protein